MSCRELHVALDKVQGGGHLAKQACWTHSDLHITPSSSAVDVAAGSCLRRWTRWRASSPRPGTWQATHSPRPTSGCSCESTDRQTPESPAIHTHLLRNRCYLAGKARTDMPLIILCPFPAFHTALNVYNMRFPPHTSVSHALRFQSQQLTQGLSNCRTLIRFDEVYVVYFKTSEGLCAQCRSPSESSSQQ